MGDRCEVVIKVLTRHAEQVVNVLGISADYFDHQIGIAEFSLSSVNYADISEESLLLTNLGIPHNWTWGEGGSYGPGEGYVTFLPEGVLKRDHFYEEDSLISYYDLSLLVAKLTHTELIEHIEKRKDEYSIPEITEEVATYGIMYVLRNS